MIGRKPIFHPETLEIGGKIQLLGKRKKFGHQTAYSFNGRFPDMEFKCVTEDGKVFIKRIL